MKTNRTAELPPFDALLAACHEAIIERRVLDVTIDVSPELVGRLRDAQDCLERLHSLWRSNPVSAAGEIPDLDALGLGAATPHTIGRFLVERELGHGGAGIVLLARDPKLGRKVALKVPRPEMLMSPDLRQRFLRESEAAARLSHPHIVAVHEVGEAGPVCFIAIEYCAGPSLAAWLAAHTDRISPRQAAQLVADLANGVHHAHTRGVLHRDLKPSNVLLSPAVVAASTASDSAADLSAYVAKVSDFGLAKLLECEGDETRTGTVLGTPRYMSPEQAEGRVRDVGVHTDVHALGAILYELLVGEPPYCGATDTETLHRLLLDMPAPPRRRRAEIPRDLEAICLKCLEKLPERRYATAAALEDDLRRYLSGEPTVARPLSLAGRGWNWARRRPAVAILSAVLVALLAAVFAGAIVYSARLQTALDDMTSQREVAREAARRSRQLLYSAEMRRADDARRKNHLAEVLEILDRQRPQEGETDRREFSWHYLKGLCHRQLFTLAAHDGDAFSVAWSPDGQTWATGGKDKIVRLWDVSTRRIRKVLTDHTGEVTRVAFSPDGEVLATASEDRTVRLWNLPEGEPRQVLKAHANHVLCLAFSPDGRWLASGSRDNTVGVWDVPSGKLISRLKGDKAYFSSAVFTHGGDMLVAGDGNGTVFCWRSGAWQLLDQRTNEAESSENMNALASAPDRNWIAGGGRRNVVHLWEATDRGLKPHRELANGHSSRIQSVAFSPLGTVVASADNFGVIQLWDIDHLGQKQSILGHTARVWSLAFSPDGRQLASSAADGSVNVWDVTARADAATVYFSSTSKVEDTAYSPDGESLAASFEGGNIRFFDTSTCAEKATIETAPDEITNLSFSPDGQRLAGRGQSGTKIWNRNDLKICLNLPATGGAPHSLAWSPDGLSLVTSTDGTTPLRLNVRSGEIEDRFEAIEAHLYGIAYSPDGQQLVAGGVNGLRVWDPQSKTLRFSLQGQGQVQYAADSSIFATGRSGEIWIYEAQSGRELQKFVSHTDATRMALSPDGNTLAMASREPGVVLCDVRTGQELVTIDIAGSRVTGLAFSPRGDRLAARGYDPRGTSQIWEWSLPANGD